MRNIVILGSTGSIGTQTLDIIRQNKDINVIGLSCNKNVSLLEKQIIEFKPIYVCTGEKNTYLIDKYPNTHFFHGTEGLAELCSQDDDYMVLNSLVGSVGFLPTLTSIKNHKKVLLANKESLVIGGEIVKEYIKKYNGVLYPIDSEHSALWMLIDEWGIENIDELIITASGGPFLNYDSETLKNVKAKDALNHPNWVMGSKITIDSSTMMNKGFELIEAYHLFDFPINKIKAIVNRESLVHALVKLKNGEKKMIIDKCSMKTPIIRALYYPEIKYHLDEQEKPINFYDIDCSKFPSVLLCLESLKKGGICTTILNASNEVLVGEFLENNISYLDIYKYNKEIVDFFNCSKSISIENILKYDKIVKELVSWRFKK